MNYSGVNCLRNIKPKTKNIKTRKITIWKYAGLPASEYFIYFLHKCMIISIQKDIIFSIASIQVLQKRRNIKISILKLKKIAKLFLIICMHIKK